MTTYNALQERTPGSGATLDERAVDCIVLHPWDEGASRKSQSAQGTRIRTKDAALEEAIGLARAIDLNIILAEIVPLRHKSPSHLFGKGVLERYRTLLQAQERDGEFPLVIIDTTLSPSQQRNIEHALHARVLDRTALVLEIFAMRARTHEGRLQVELAAMTWQRTRLVRSWTHLERQRGGSGFMGGPGETQIESDRRMIDARITILKRQLKDISRTRTLHRKSRQKVPWPIVALVGYTNAGKSTLFNHLTHARVMVQDQLFATLDPTMRRIALASGEKVILSDTVGFISDLPHELVEAFQATLEEVTEADIIVHVRDSVHPDTQAQKHDVLEVLESLGMYKGGEQNTVPIIEVLNKVDVLDEETRQQWQVASTSLGRHQDTVPRVMLSARTGEGVATFTQCLEDVLTRAYVSLQVTVPYDDGKELAWFYDHARICTRHDGAAGIELQVRLSPANAARYAQQHNTQEQAYGAS